MIWFWQKQGDDIRSLQQEVKLLREQVNHLNGLQYHLRIGELIDHYPYYNDFRPKISLHDTIVLILDHLKLKLKLTPATRATPSLTYITHDPSDKIT